MKRPRILISYFHPVEIFWPINCVSRFFPPERFFQKPNIGYHKTMYILATVYVKHNSAWLLRIDLPFIVGLHSRIISLHSLLSCGGTHTIAPPQSAVALPWNHDNVDRQQE